MSLRHANVIVLQERSESDRSALATLAALDYAAPSPEPVVLAFCFNRLLAALSLRNGRAVADPWHWTDELVAAVRGGLMSD